MSAENRPRATLPPELAERVHVYLAAFLAPAAADEAYREIAEDAVFWGDQEPVQVLASAHRALETRIRIATEVEVLVLAEDAELPVDDIAAVLDLRPDEVRAMLDEALAELAEPDPLPPGPGPSTSPSPEPESDPEPGSEAEPQADPGTDGPTSDWPPALVADEPDEGPASPADPVSAVSERTQALPDVGDDLDEIDALAEGAEEESRWADAGWDEDDRRVLSGAVLSTTPSETARSPLRDAVDEPGPDPASERSAAPDETAPSTTEAPRRTWVLVALGVAVLVLIGIVIASLAGGGSEDPTTAGITCEDAPVCITEAVLTTTVNQQGQPGEPRSSFTTDDDVQLWFAFQRNIEGPITLEVRWFRGGEELYRSPFRLAAVDRLNLTLAKLFMEEPGSYGVQIVASDDQVLLERDFEVGPGAGGDAPAGDAAEDVSAT